MRAATDLQGGSFLGRISIRRNQIVSVDNNNEQHLEAVDLFQKHISDRFSDLLLPPSESHPYPILSIAWIRALLDAYLCCEAEFKATLIASRDLTKPPLDRLIPDLLDRSLKTLDLCNAISHGLDSLRSYQKLAEIAVIALEHRPVAPGAVRRAQKALTTLLATISSDELESAPPTRSTERTWSIGRRASRGTSTLRSLSWTVSRTWSAAKQVQAMASGLGAPRGNETTGTALPVYAMSAVMVVVMWALVASLPCQERGGLGLVHFGLPKNAGWAQPVASLHERIADEWRKKEKRKSGAGLVGEMEQLERIGQLLVDFAESFQSPVKEARGEEVAGQVRELKEVCKRMEEGLLPLQRQIREVFRKTVKSRSEILEILDHATCKPPSAQLM